MQHQNAFLSIFLKTEEDTQRLGEDLSTLLKKGDCILLSGDLGMGKTTLSRALIRAFLGKLDYEVPSPTFTLVNPYEEGRLPLYHFDLYRLSDEEELEETGIFDVLPEGVSLIEWPERAMGVLPKNALKIILEQKDKGRKIYFYGHEDWQKRVSRNFFIRRFLEENGWQNARRQFLQGDASSRSYEKILGAEGRQAVLMDAPANYDGPIIKKGKRYAQIAHLAEDVRPFIAIGNILKEQDLPAPELYAHDIKNGLLLVEYFGNETIAKDNAVDQERYEKAVDCLVEMHQITWPRELPLPDGTFHRPASFDKHVFEIELSLLKDWFVPNALEKPIEDQNWVNYWQIWYRLFDDLNEMERSLFLRDYHSPNLMWRKEKEGLQKIGLIDYQDALFGPSSYDVASLCQDARQTVHEDLEEVLKARYCAGRKKSNVAFDEVAFEYSYAIIAAERATRLLGLWWRLKIRDGKPQYMEHMPRTIDYLKRALAHPKLDDLKKWYQENLDI